MGRPERPILARTEDCGGGTTTGLTYTTSGRTRLMED